MTENIPDLGTQSNNSELLTEIRKRSLEYIISNNFRNFSDCGFSQRKNLVDDIDTELNKKWYPTKGKDLKNYLLLLLLHSILMSDSSYFSFPSTRPFFSLSTHPVTNRDHKLGSPIQDGLNFVPYHFSRGDWFGMGYHSQVIQISSLWMKYRSREKGTDSSQWCCYEGMLAACLPNSYLPYEKANW